MNAPIIDDKYPNLRAILNGTISGSFREWPLIRVELQALSDEVEEWLTGLIRG